MMSVFADTAYWVALANPRDGLHVTARSLKKKLSGAQRYTTEEVLTEFLTMFSGQGRWLRDVAVMMVRAIEEDPDTLVISQSSSSFHEGVRLYGERPDKKYSLQDCISMNTMRSRGITEVLTSDHHFEQEGFTILMKPQGQQSGA